MSTPVVPGERIGDAAAPGLFTEYTLRGITFRNRIAVSPMCQYSSRDGFANDWHRVHLGSRATGGAGLVITEAAAVEERGRITPADLGLWKDEQIEVLAAIAGFIQQQGAAAGIQLAHAGRKASTHVPWEGGAALAPHEGAWQTVAPGAIPFRPEDPSPRALARNEIRAVVEAFANAAKRALNAGFQVVEIHAAHGYLLHEFLSPLSNAREDEYGGSFENRTRLLLEVCDATRAVWPEKYPLFVRLSCTDWAEGGWTLDDSIALSGRLRAHGVDLIDCSSGGLVPWAKIETRPGYQVSFAARIRHEAGIPTGAVGLITEPRQANSIIAEGEADMVLLARAMLRHPYWPLHAARVLGHTIRGPVQYGRAF